MAGPGGLTIMYKIENVFVVAVNQQMNWNSAVQIGDYLFTSNFFPQLVMMLFHSLLKVTVEH